MRLVSRLLVVPVMALAWLAVIAPTAPEPGQEVLVAGSAGGELAWREPGVVFEPDVARNFIRSDFLPQAETSAYPENTVLAFSGDTCPPGWAQLTASEDAAPLFYAFGLLVDAGGVPRSEYVRVPACVKQQ